MEKQINILNENLEIFKTILVNDYSFLSVATESEILHFEKQFNIKLPEDYKWFLLNIANGIVHKKEVGSNLLDKIDFLNFYFEELEFNPSIIFSLDKKTIVYKYESDEYPYEINVNNDLDYFEDCTNGSIPILGTGCGCNYFIVVNGEEYGNIWIDNFSSMQEVYPAYDKLKNKKRLQFFEWIILNMERKIINQVYKIK